MQFFHLPTILPFAAGALATALAIDGLAEGRDRFPIDLEAARAAAEQRFRNADADGDGLISEQEFLAVDPRSLRPDGDRHKRRRADSPHVRPEGSAERQRLARQQRFEAGDSDGDGVLSAEEYAALPEANRRQGQQRLFAGLDDDQDGMLTPEEFPNPARRLEGLDADGDGQISRDEFARRRHR